MMLICCQTIGRIVCLLLMVMLAVLHSCCQQGVGQEDFRFPRDFIWGVASSAYQTEGNNRNDWEREIQKSGRYPTNGLATDYYHLYDADHQLAQSLGVRMVRFSVEWSRIEPQKGQYNLAEIQHYRELIQSIRDRGMVPLLTLHHFTNPLWLADEGGWDSPDVVERFAAYAQTLAQAYGDLVDNWSTINEPMVYLVGLNLVGMYPGGKVMDIKAMQRTTANIIFAHAAAVDAIRQADTADADGDGKAAKIVLVQAISPMFPADLASAQDAEAANRYDSFYNHLMINAWVKGDLDLDFDGRMDSTNTPVPEGNYPELARRADIIGINYYGRAFVMDCPGVFPPIGAIPCIAPLSCGAPNEMMGDNGGEVYPPGLYQAVSEMAEYGLPMMISENGVADAEGKLRADFVVMHLMQLARAIHDGYKVIGYLHWSLTDNYEWAMGYDMRFGLYRVDYTNQQRSVTTGGEVYGEIVRNNGISQQWIDQYNHPSINQMPTLSTP